MGPLIFVMAHGIFFFLLIFLIFIFIYLAALCLSCNMCDLLPWPGIEPWLPALGAQNLSHQTSREVPTWDLCTNKISSLFIISSVSLSGCSVQFSHSVVSDSLRPHESQHARPPCSSQTPGVYSNYAHRVSDVIQPSHPLSSPSPPAPNPSQHQGLFQGVNSSHDVAKVLEFQLQHQSFQWIPRTYLL